MQMNEQKSNEFLRPPSHSRYYTCHTMRCDVPKQAEGAKMIENISLYQFRKELESPDTDTTECLHQDSKTSPAFFACTRANCQTLHISCMKERTGTKMKMNLIQQSRLRSSINYECMFYQLKNSDSWTDPRLN